MSVWHELHRSMDGLTAWAAADYDAPKAPVHAFEAAAFPKAIACLEPSLKSVYWEEQKVYRESSERPRLKWSKRSELAWACV
jgi:hypothetical protein